MIPELMQTSSLYKLLQTQLAMLIHKFNYEAFDICKHIHKVQKQVLKKLHLSKLSSKAVVEFEEFNIGSIMRSGALSVMFKVGC